VNAKQRGLKNTMEELKYYIEGMSYANEID